MNILFIGDISGRPGREAVGRILPQLKSENKIDFVIANCENAAGGRGVTRAIVEELLSYGIDFFTTGDHVWDQKEFLLDLQDENLPLVRPLNYEKSDIIPGLGYKEIDLGALGKIVVISLLGQIFMRQNVRSPFWIFDELFEEKKAKWNNSTIIVDFHAEATSEKIAFGKYLQNRVTAVCGTHTHVGTVDTRQFDGTGYITDVGMVGPKDAVLWVKYDRIIHDFKYPYKKSFEIEKNPPYIFNSVLIKTTQNVTEYGIKRCQKIERIDKVLLD